MYINFETFKCFFVSLNYDLKNYYQILNVSRNASLNDIKKAYRKLALLYHPDVNKNKDANAKFILINKAYNTLIDHNKRKQYDRFIDLGITVEILHKKQEKEQKERYKKYGTANRFKEYQNYRSKQTFSKEDEKQFAQLEKMMFFILVIISIYGAYFGIKQLFFEEWEHFEHPIAGFIFALLFPTLLIYGYKVIYKRKY